MIRSVIVAALLLVACLPLTAAAQPSSFGAETSAPAAPAAAPGDLEGMLRSCDAQLRACETSSELCEKDRTGVGFLGAAYIAMWAILMVFFVLVRVRQRRLSAEMQELRARLAKAESGA